MTASVVAHLKLIKTTDKAAYFQAGDKSYHWLPLSQIEFDLEDDETGDVVLPKWLADKKDLEYDEA